MLATTALVSRSLGCVQLGCNYSTSVRSTRHEIAPCVSAGYGVIEIRSAEGAAHSVLQPRCSAGPPTRARLEPLPNPHSPPDRTSRLVRWAIISMLLMSRQLKVGYLGLMDQTLCTIQSMADLQLVKFFLRFLHLNGEHSRLTSACGGPESASQQTTCRANDKKGQLSAEAQFIEGRKAYGWRAQPYHHAEESARIDSFCASA